MRTDRPVPLTAGLLALLALGTAGAQQPRRQFDVASIKLNTSGNPAWNVHVDRGRLQATAVPLKSLILIAYDIHSYQLSGGPSWLSTTDYDITAKTEQPASDEETGLMFQALLENRFGLKLRRETRQHAVYALVQAKGGARLKRSQTGEHGSGNLTSNQNSITATAVEIPHLASALTEGLDLPVIDKTNLTGRFDFNLHWELPEQHGTDAIDRSAGIITAVQEQLGLKLQPEKGPVEMLIIEHIDHPTELTVE